MPDQISAQFARLLIGAALLFPFYAHAQMERLYRVELMVFSYPGGGASEQWDATPDLAYPESTRALISATPPDPLHPTPFATLPSAQRELDGKATEMQRSGRYHILFHEAWIQPMTSESEATSIVLDRSGDGGQWPALQGTIKLYLSNDINLETNLWLNTQGEYLHSAWRMPQPPLGPPSVALQPQSIVSEPKDRTYPYRHAVLLQQTRHMRSGEVNYIDHPMLGVVVKVMPLSGIGPEAPAQSGTTTEPKPGLETTPPS
jgi:Peptidoglycan-binding protein, CsiV